MKTKRSDNEEVTSYFHMSMDIMFNLMKAKESIKYLSKFVIAAMIKEFEQIHKRVVPG